MVFVLGVLGADVAVKQIIGLALSCFAFGLGIWLAVSPTSYLRANVKYKSVKSWWSEKEVQSSWWQLAIRLLGLAILAFTAVYVVAIVHSSH